MHVIITEEKVLYRLIHSMPSNSNTFADAFCRLNSAGTIITLGIGTLHTHSLKINIDHLN